MDIVQGIRDKFVEGQFELSRHAVDRSILRWISVQEIREAVQNSEMIENYPDDKYGPTCLLFGFTRDGRPLHVQCSYPSRPIVKVVTMYEPDPSEWIEFQVRKKQDRD